jgi:glycerol-3-phosphate dehydrogenase
VKGVTAVDAESGEEFDIRGKVVVNATGVFADAIRRMDDPDASPMIAPSQGVHIVLDKSFLPGQSAILVPHTSDGRVLFAVPWHDRVIVGTTDTKVTEIPLEPVPLEEELDFLLSHAAQYLTQDPTPGDVLSMFAGLRPLVDMGRAESTAAISRDHTLHISSAGLVTITGGKWTTYRKMAQDTVDQAVLVGLLPDRPCVTEELNIHGYHRHTDGFGDFAIYGSDAISLRDFLKDEDSYGERIHPNLPQRLGEVVWAARHEMARTVEDFLARRCRALLLDARASIQMAPKVADVLAAELGKDAQWKQVQVESYRRLAESCLMG